MAHDKRVVVELVVTESVNEVVVLCVVTVDVEVVEVSLQESQSIGQRYLIKLPIKTLLHTATSPPLESDEQSASSRQSVVCVEPVVSVLRVDVDVTSVHTSHVTGQRLAKIETSQAAALLFKITPQSCTSSIPKQNDVHGARFCDSIIKSSPRMQDA